MIFVAAVHPSLFVVRKMYYRGLWTFLNPCYSIVTGTIVVSVTTGVFEYVDSTPRLPDEGERLLVSLRRDRLTLFLCNSVGLFVLRKERNLNHLVFIY